jgi:glycosyltransferase involved in cell wall biosynthesis
MKIGIYCTNNLVYPVPPGTIYASMSIAGQIADTLAQLGEDVTFFAPVGTTTKANLVTFDMLPFVDSQISRKYPHIGSSYEYENIMLMQIYNYMEKNNFDIFHSHTRPFSTLNFAPMKPKIPTILTVHDPLNDEAYKILPLYNQFSNVHLVSISHAQRKFQPNITWLDTVYNGINLNDWTYSDKPGKYLLSVGRIMPNKGPDLAVQVALKSQLPLKLAGTIYPGDQKYFNHKIKPFLGKNIQYLGGLSKEKISQLYTDAIALLMPIRWPEPFGLVMIEAMASGTPVIGTNNGSVSEIINDKVTGYVLKANAGVQDYLRALNKIGEIDRSACHEHVKQKFSHLAMVNAYKNLYQKVLEDKL